MADQEIQASGKQEVAPDRGEFTREGVYFTPAVDIYESEKELVLLVDMPGVSGDDIDIELKEDILSIEGKLASEQPSGESLLTEFRTGNYFRTFRITDLVDRAKISASMNDGVLQLKLPKAEKAVPRKIPIST